MNRAASNAHGIASGTADESARSVLLEVVAFTGTMILAAALRWRATELIWGLWASSLCVGYATIVATVVVGARRVPGPRALKLAGALGVLAFFTFHFGMFHFVHGMFLGSFFPLPGTEALKPNPVHVLTVPIRVVWPFVLASFLARWRDIVPEDATLTRQNSFMRPYGNVVRMHILIFVFAGLHIMDLTRYAIYPVLVFYFFPWKNFMRVLRGEETA